MSPDKDCIAPHWAEEIPCTEAATKRVSVLEPKAFRPRLNLCKLSAGSGSTTAIVIECLLVPVSLLSSDLRTSRLDLLLSISTLSMVMALVACVRVENMVHGSFYSTAGWYDWHVHGMVTCNMSHHVTVMKWSHGQSTIDLRHNHQWLVPAILVWLFPVGVDHKLNSLELSWCVHYSMFKHGCL